MARWWTLIFTSGILIVSGCSRPVSNNSTKITIQAPAAYGKVGAMAAMPANRRVCYAVNVFGSGIDQTPASPCNPVMGVVGGFIESGKEISLSVPSGSSRTIELFAYLLPANDSTSSCPTLGKILTDDIRRNTYRVGSAAEVTVQGAQQTVEITASYPGDSQYLAAELHMPAFCTAAAQPGTYPNPRNDRVSAGMQSAASTSYQIKARIGQAYSGQVASSANFSLKAK